MMILSSVNVVCYTVIVKLGYPLTDLKNVNKTDGLNMLKYRL